MTIHPKWLRWQYPYLFKQVRGDWRICLDGEKGKAF